MTSVWYAEPWLIGPMPSAAPPGFVYMISLKPTSLAVWSREQYTRNMATGASTAQASIL